MSSNRILIKLASGDPAAVKISLETEALVAAILESTPTPAIYASYLQRMITKATGDTPYLVDVELALLDDLVSALPEEDFTRLQEARDAWSTAYAKLLPEAQKGAAMLTRCIRVMFNAVTQVEFERKITQLIEGLPEDERVAALEFAEELLTTLVTLVETRARTWNPDEVNYIDNHIYYQLYMDIVEPSMEVRGRALAIRRLNILSKLLRTFQF